VALEVTEAAAVRAGPAGLELITASQQGLRAVREAAEVPVVRAERAALVALDQLPARLAPRAPVARAALEAWEAPAAAVRRAPSMAVPVGRVLLEA
jgi:hypothetical protein